MVIVINLLSRVELLFFLIGVVLSLLSFIIDRLNLIVGVYNTSVHETVLAVDYVSLGVVLLVACLIILEKLFDGG